MAVFPSASTACSVTNSAAVEFNRGIGMMVTLPTTYAKRPQHAAHPPRDANYRTVQSILRPS